MLGSVNTAVLFEELILFFNNINKPVEKDIYCDVDSLIRSSSAQFYDLGSSIF
jgi:hypothetical protein